MRPCGRSIGVHRYGVLVEVIEMLYMDDNFDLRVSAEENKRRNAALLSDERAVKAMSKYYKQTPMRERPWMGVLPKVRKNAPQD